MTGYELGIIYSYFQYYVWLPDALKLQMFPRVQLPRIDLRCFPARMLKWEYHWL